MNEICTILRENKEHAEDKGGLILVSSDIIGNVIYRNDKIK